MNTLTSVLTRNQKFTTPWKQYKEQGQTFRIRCEIRYDDECNNGHNTFAITGDIQEHIRNRWAHYASGCIHENIEKHFPEYRHLIKWHLVSSDGPMHYIANTCYHASNLDCNGKLKGEAYRFERSLKFNGSPFVYKPKNNLLKFIDEVGLNYPWADAELLAVEHDKSGGYDFKPQYTLAAMPVVKWHECPFKDLQEANNFIYGMTQCKVEIVSIATAYGEGKEREFEAARSSAVWPEATEEQLSLPKTELTELLTARLPALLAEFKKDVEALGFTY